jgi:hypothetical protein
MHASPATVRRRPVGTLVNVCIGPNIAVTLLLAFIVTLPGDVVLVTSPLNPINPYPEFGVATIVACAPLLYRHPLGHAGVIFPPAAGFTLVVNVYCCGAVAPIVQSPTRCHPLQTELESETIK